MTDPRSATGPAISVVIPVHDGAHFFARSMPALFASEGVRFEVVVVDDGSTDDPAAALVDYPVRIEQHDRARGAAAARNTGAAAARAPLVCFIDADIEVAPDTLARIVRALEDQSLAGVVGMLSADTEPRNFASQYENLYMHFTYRVHPPEMDIFYTSIAAIRRDVLLDVGGFDEHYRGAGIEDMELGQRLVARGHRLRLDHELQVRHLKRFAVGQLLRINRAKAAGSLKIMLRNRAAGRRATKHVGPGWAFLAGIPLVPLGAVAAVGGLLWRSWALGAVAAGCFVFVLVANRRFLGFVARERSLPFVFASAPFLLVQFMNYGVGLASGVAGYWAGNRY